MSERKCVLAYIIIAWLVVVLLLVVIFYFGKSITNQFNKSTATAEYGAGTGDATIEKPTKEAASRSSKFSSPSFKGRIGSVGLQQVGASVLMDDSVVPPDGGCSASEFFSTTNKQQGVWHPSGFDGDF